jgi:hypothetical protein
MGAEPDSDNCSTNSIIINGPYQGIIATQRGASRQSIIIGNPIFRPPPFFPPPMYQPIYQQPTYASNQREYTPPKELKKVFKKFKNADLRNKNIKVEWIK